MANRRSGKGRKGVAESRLVLWILILGAVLVILLRLLTTIHPHGHRLR